MYKTALLPFLALLTVINGSRILAVFPFTCQSQHILGSALLKDLARRGHDVTMISPFPLKEKLNNYHDVFLESMAEFKKNNMSKMIDPNNNAVQKMIAFFDSVRTQTAVYLDDPNLVRFLKTKPKFDVVIQAWSFSEATLGIGHVVQAPTIGFSVMGGFPSLNYHTGVPQPYSYVPNLFLPFTDQMGYFERLTNSLVNLAFDVAIRFINLPFQEKLLQKHFPTAPPLNELINSVDLHLINSHPATESPRPYLPNMIQIGGFHLQEKEALSEDLQHFLDSSKAGVIFFSLGTMVQSSTLPASTIKSILNTFKEFNYDFLWKFEANLNVSLKNVKIINWVPQRAVLSHPKVRAFVTHGGLGSVVEAIYHGVPMVCIPFFADQQKNVADAVQRGYGVHLDVHDINKESLGRALREITENPAYELNAKVRSDFYQNQDVNPMDKAVYWIEHVIKYKGAKHLRARASDLPTYQYLLIDVICLLAGVILFSLYVMIYVVRKLFCSSKNSVRVDKVKIS